VLSLFCFKPCPKSLLDWFSGVTGEMEDAVLVPRLDRDATDDDNPSLTNIVVVTSTTGIAFISCVVKPFS
jgi:hypothetical protein